MESGLLARSPRRLRRRRVAGHERAFEANVVPPADTQKEPHWAPMFGPGNRMARSISMKRNRTIKAMITSSFAAANRAA